MADTIGFLSPFQIKQKRASQKKSVAFFLTSKLKKEKYGARKNGRIYFKQSNSEAVDG